MFVDPLQYPKSIITIERRRSIHSMCKAKHKNPLSFGLKNGITSDTSDNDRENEKDNSKKDEKSNKGNSNTNKDDNENKNDEETSTPYDSSLPYHIPLKESNPTLIPVNNYNNYFFLYII